MRAPPPPSTAREKQVRPTRTRTRKTNGLSYAAHITIEEWPTLTNAYAILLLTRGCCGQRAAVVGAGLPVTVCVRVMRAAAGGGMADDLLVNEHVKVLVALQVTPTALQQLCGRHSGLQPYFEPGAGWVPRARLLGGGYLTLPDIACNSMVDYLRSD